MLVPMSVFIGLAGVSLYWHHGQLNLNVLVPNNVNLVHLAVVITLSVGHIIFLGQTRRYIKQLIESRDNNQRLAQQKTNVLREEIRQHKAARSELQRLATHDQLTGARNRRHFRDTLNSEMERHKRYRNDFSLLILDLDNFQNINEIYGHDCGDLILQKFAQFIQKNLRQSDVFVRYGGQEFAIIATSTEVDAATRFANKLCQNIETQAIRYEANTIHVTVSIGVASPSLIDELSSQNLINASESALRQAKQSGRNQAVCFSTLK